MQHARRRRRQGRFDNRHSAWVARLKVVLPLTALAILSTVFLLADRQGPAGGTAQGPEGRAANGDAARPDYAGIGANGAALRLTAERARPTEPGGEIEAREVRGVWEGTGGSRVVVTSDDGTLGRNRRSATLTGAVDVQTDSGFRLTSRRLDVDADAGRIVSPGPVEGTAPAGRIDAGGMVVLQEGERPLITFTDGVKVVYDPERPTGG